MSIDVETLNAVIKLLEREIQSYPPDSPESAALFKFKEKLADL